MSSLNKLLKQRTYFYYKVKLFYQKNIGNVKVKKCYLHTFDFEGMIIVRVRLDYS